MLEGSQYGHSETSELACPDLQGSCNHDLDSEKVVERERKGQIHMYLEKLMGLFMVRCGQCE